MSTPIRVAHVDELPPGKGKLVQLGGVELTVYNLEGRFYATASHAFHIGGDQLPGHAASVSVCGASGVHFDATVESQPAEAPGEPSRYPVAVDGEYVIVYVEDPVAD